jgi:phenylalanyl-tRNA synthetase beta chain
LKTDENEVGAKNQRQLCVVYSNKSSGFEVIHGILDQIMTKVGISQEKGGYRIQKNDEKMFFPGRGADVLQGDKKIGVTSFLLILFRSWVYYILMYYRLSI